MGAGPDQVITEIVGLFDRSDRGLMLVGYLAKRFTLLDFMALPAQTLISG